MASFWIFTFCALGLISIQGGSEGRRFSLFVIIATSSTFISNLTLTFLVAQPLVVIIDSLLLAAVAHIAMTSKAYWPVWFCGFHTVTVASGLAGIAFPAQLPLLYTNLAGFWAVPALAAAVAGILLDRRVRLSS